jgi:hypothetical protein
MQSGVRNYSKFTKKKPQEHPTNYPKNQSSLMRLTTLNTRTCSTTLHNPPLIQLIIDIIEKNENKNLLQHFVSRLNLLEGNWNLIKYYGWQKREFFIVVNLASRSL